MEQIIIKIATEFTDAPGARSKTDGPNSGEEFFEKLLEPKFAQAQKEGKRLLVNFDGSWGYASSFLSGSFGRLADKFGSKTVLAILDYESADDPTIPEKVKKEVEKSDNHA